MTELNENHHTFTTANQRNSVREGHVVDATNFLKSLNHSGGSKGGEGGLLGTSTELAIASAQQQARQNAELQKQFKKQFDAQQTKIHGLETKTTAQQNYIVELRDRLEASLEDSRSVQKLLESLSEKVEAEEVATVNTAAQVDYLGRQTKALREQQLNPTQASYWAVASWVYVPLLHLAKGLWVLLFPLVQTFYHLTLFHPLRQDERDEQRSEAVAMKSARSQGVCYLGDAPDPRRYQDRQGLDDSPAYESLSASTHLRKAKRGADERNGGGVLSSGSVFGGVSPSRKTAAAGNDCGGSGGSLLGLLQSGALDPEAFRRARLQQQEITRCSGTE